MGSLLTLAPLLLVCAPSAVSATAQQSSAGTYAGFTSQGYPVVVVVSADGRQVKRASASLLLTCSDGQSPIVSDEFSRLPLAASGRFSSRFAGSTGEGFDGAPTTFSGSIAGSVKGSSKAFSGRWTATQTVHNADGTTRICSSGKVSLKASALRNPSRPLGGFYGGFTSRGFPVVVQLAPDGRKVIAIRGMFDLKCSLGGFRYIRDDWAQLPVSGGSNRFRASVTDQAATFTDGTSYTVSSSTSGAIDRAGRTARGRWRVVWKIPEAGGIDICDSGPLAFSVTR